MTFSIDAAIAEAVEQREQRRREAEERRRQELEHERREFMLWMRPLLDQEMSREAQSALKLTFVVPEDGNDAPYVCAVIDGTEWHITNIRETWSLWCSQYEVKDWPSRGNLFRDLLLAVHDQRATQASRPVATTSSPDSTEERLVDAVRLVMSVGIVDNKTFLCPAEDADQLREAYEDLIVERDV